jgi:excisionase family DNA binding protein
MAVKGERSESPVTPQVPWTGSPETTPSNVGEAETLRQTERRTVVTVSLDPKWYTVAEVARMLGYGETKVRMLIIAGDLRSLKDGRSRRVSPQWVDEYVEMRAAQADEQRYL